MWPSRVFVNAIGTAVVADSAADVNAAVGAEVTVNALSPTSLLFWLLLMLLMLQVAIFVSGSDVDINFCRSWFIRDSSSNVTDDVIAVAAVVVASIVIDVAFVDFNVVPGVAVVRAGGVIAGV